MYDIITFGSAAQDIHLKSKAFKIIKDQANFGAPFGSGEGICLPFGSKVDIEDIVFTSGGGGTNTAATFSKQGFRVAFCGAIGADSAGLEIVRELKQLKIDTRFLVKKKEKQTNCSVVISGNSERSSISSGQDRTILVYRGASDILNKDDIPWHKIKKTRWFYLAPLSGLLCDSAERGQGTLSVPTLFEQLVNFARENEIKVAVNPSKQQLSMPEEGIKRIFAKVDVLFLNQEEASYLTKINFENENEIFKKIDKICPGVAVMTKGGEGVVVSDGKYLYSAKPNPERKVIDTTGAGDSFAAGFLSDFIRHNGDIEKAVQLGLANSAANLSDVGAKTGLLDKNSEFKRVSVARQECGENNLCISKSI